MGAGDKPYRCNAPGCGYASSDSGALQRHSRLHSGQRPARCDFPGCSYAVSDFSCARPSLPAACPAPGADLLVSSPYARAVVIIWLAWPTAHDRRLAREIQSLTRSPKLLHTGT